MRQADSQSGADCEWRAEVERLRAHAEMLDNMRHMAVESGLAASKRARELGAALARVTELHRCIYVDFGAAEQDTAVCDHCRTGEGEFVDYPCATIRAIHPASD